MIRTMNNASSSALAGVLVVEHGRRIGAAVCGSWLAQLGATVVVMERREFHDLKSPHRDQLCARKLSFAPERNPPRAARRLEDLISHSDLVITSSDVDANGVAFPPRRDGQIFCDITALGKDSSSECPYSDAQIQALTGIVDTTGLDGGAPTLIPLPVVEYLTGMHSAGAC